LLLAILADEALEVEHVIDISASFRILEQGPVQAGELGTRLPVFGIVGEGELEQALGIPQGGDAIDLEGAEFLLALPQGPFALDRFPGGQTRLKYPDAVL
jgi:hypothetical protein